MLHRIGHCVAPLYDHVGPKAQKHSLVRSKGWRTEAADLVSRAALAEVPSPNPSTQYNRECADGTREFPYMYSIKRNTRPSNARDDITLLA